MSPQPADTREALEWIRQWVRRRDGLIVLIRPSIEVAVSAVLGALESSSIHGSARVYIADPRRQELKRIFEELRKSNLDGEVTLFHGSLNDFFRDLPLSADLIYPDSVDLDLGASALRSMLPAGTTILSVGAANADSAAAKYLIDNGILEIEEAGPGGAAYIATPRCRGVGFIPKADLRIRLRTCLHNRYFVSEAGAESGHTPIADLTEEIRRGFSRECPAVSGSGAWPYVAPESDGLPLTLPSGKPWPKISIVTPTRNHGRYIEETILSVLNQEYPKVEYIIVDGASTDETPCILERYRNKVALIISEPDNGQSEAINKGMSKATGDILTWLNSDDMLAPGALAAVALALDTNHADMIAGVCRLYRDGKLVGQHLTACADGPLPLENLLDLDHGWTAGQFFHQPEVLFTREIWMRAGGRLDEQLFYSMDYELWLRFARAGARIHVIGRPLAWFRVHDQQKTFAMSSYLPELTTCRDAFIKENGIAPQPAPLGPSGRERLRVTLLNDCGGFYGAGIAHVRLARALAWAGHELSLVSILATPGNAKGTGHTSESVLDRVAESNPDLVVVGNLHNANADPILLQLLAERFPTIVVMHDFWILTGRCGYTASCEKYLTGCDDACPTADEYPVLAPAMIADVWMKKRFVLGSKNRPLLVANSQWTAAFARKALAADSYSNFEERPIEVVRLSFPLDVFRPRNRQSCREQLGLPLDRFIVLLPAALDDPRKGARVLLDALARLQLPGLLVVTVGWPSPTLDCPIEVRQLGYISDPHRVALLNSAADVVVAPSSAETFGQIFIEAIACGTPVAGYPLAAVPEAIRDGVTGILASDDSPASLAAATHYLYSHPELRRDLARWGRLYVENEWSEFSSYRSLFLALYAFGLHKTLKLRRTIGFRHDVPTIPPMHVVSQPTGHWRPCRGFSEVEQSVDHDMEDYRWVYGPAALAEIVVDAPGEYTILISYRNPHVGQRLKLSLNGAVLGTHELPETGYESSRLLVQNVRFNSESNLLHFEFSRWYLEERDGRPLALIVHEILVEKLGKWDRLATMPTSQGAFSAAWGERGVTL